MYLDKVRKSAEGMFLIIVACEFTDITLEFKLVDIFTLQDRCRETIVSTCIISKKPDIGQLSTSTKIKGYYKDHDDVKIKIIYMIWYYMCKNNELTLILFYFIQHYKYMLYSDNGVTYSYNAKDNPKKQQENVTVYIDRLLYISCKQIQD